MPEFEQAFLQGFDHKNVLAVLGIYPGHGYKWLVHNTRIVQSESELFTGDTSERQSFTKTMTSPEGD